MQTATPDLDPAEPEELDPDSGGTMMPNTTNPTDTELPAVIVSTPAAGRHRRAAVRAAMLTISKPLNAAQAQTYHAKEFTSPEQNYWQKGDINLGEWQGKLADSFGLSGPVDAAHFARLSEGQHPITGEQMVRHRAVQEYETESGKTVKAGRAPGGLGCYLFSAQVGLADRAGRRR